MNVTHSLAKMWYSTTAVNKMFVLPVFGIPILRKCNTGREQPLSSCAPDTCRLQPIFRDVPCSTRF